MNSIIKTKQLQDIKGLGFILVSCYLLFSACTKTIEIPLEYGPKVVIQAVLTQDSCYAHIAQSLSYSDTSRQILAIKNAEILIDDGSNTDTLIHDENGFYYNPNKTITHQYGQHYSIRVIVDKGIYSAYCNLPAQNPKLSAIAISLRDTVVEDSVMLSRVGRLSIGFDAQKDTKYWLRVWANDKEHQDIELYSATETTPTNYTTDLLGFGLLKSGTVLNVMLCQLSEPTYDYLYSLLSINQNIALPSIVGTYVQPISIFDNAGLGYFAAITTDTMSLIVP